MTSLFFSTGAISKDYAKVMSPSLRMAQNLTLMWEPHLSHSEQMLGILQVTKIAFICPDAVLSKEKHSVDNMGQLAVISDFVLSTSLNYLNVLIL